MADLINKLKKLHGSLFSEGPWCSEEFNCCKLCKTSNTIEDKLRHWARGLCRSCYRRLSVVHRLYNDQYYEEHSHSIDFNKKETSKKSYKDSAEEIKFDPKDIETMLERYDFKCAYCKFDLQVYDHTKLDALQVEYRLNEVNKFELVPVCRSCNCSKKALIDAIKLKRWARERGIKFPFEYIKP